MWKVKRMNTARIIVLTIAPGAGGIAAYPAGPTTRQPRSSRLRDRRRQARFVARSDIGLGRAVKPERTSA